MKCEVCRSGAPTITEDEIQKLLPQIPQWDVVGHHDVKQLEREFKFKNFADALAFTNKVGELAEENGHHPAILTEWGRVTISYWTHKIKGLHRSDFTMAAKTDELFEQ